MVLLPNMFLNNVSIWCTKFLLEMDCSCCTIALEFSVFIKATYATYYTFIRLLCLMILFRIYKIDGYVAVGYFMLFVTNILYWNFV